MSLNRITLGTTGRLCYLCTTRLCRTSTGNKGGFCRGDCGTVCHSLSLDESGGGGSYSGDGRTGLVTHFISTIPFRASL